MVLGCFEKVNVPLEKSAIERTHRIGVSYVDRDSGKLVKAIIVKFKSWNDRSAFYKARPRAFTRGVKKPGHLPFRVSLDLTKRRNDLLQHAKGMIENNPKYLFVFTDINCFLVIKDVNNKFHHFNSKGELDAILMRE